MGQPHPPDISTHSEFPQPLACEVYRLTGLALSPGKGSPRVNRPEGLSNLLHVAGACQRLRGPVSLGLIQFA